MNDIQTQRTPDIIGAEIRGLTQQAKTMTVWFGIEIGRRLTEAKEMLVTIPRQYGLVVIDYVKQLRAQLG